MTSTIPRHPPQSRARSQASRSSHLYSHVQQREGTGAEDVPNLERLGRGSQARMCCLAVALLSAPDGPLLFGMAMPSQVHESANPEL